MENTETQSLISIREAARILNVHIETMRRWDREGKLKAVRIGQHGRRRYRSIDITAIIKK